MTRCLGLCVCVSLSFAAPVCRLGAQAGAVSPPAQWRGWAFVRIGPAQTWRFDTHARPGAVFDSFGAGVTASYGSILGMVRATDNEGPCCRDNQPNPIHDYAVLAGARSRGDGVFFAAAAGIAKADDTPSGILGPTNAHLAPTFDVSAHADYRIAGVALALSGVLGPASTRYVAISFGAEIGWFGH